MTILRDKARINFEAGEMLVFGNKYAPSIHCYYYSCLQLIKFTLHDFFGESYEKIEMDIKNASKKKISSHQYLIDYISNQLEREYSQKDSAIFSRRIKDLRELRNKSDYNDFVIDENVCVAARKKALGVREQLQEIFHV